MSLICLAAGAQAQSVLPNTPQAVIGVAQQFGTAYFEPPDSEGRPAIAGTIDGLNYGVLFYGCEGNVGCDSLQFYASFTGYENSLEFINSWNYDKRFASAYRRPDGSVVLSYDVNIDFGVTATNVEDTFDIWSILMGQFMDRINGVPEGGDATK